MKRFLTFAFAAVLALRPSSAEAQAFQGVPDATEYLQFLGAGPAVVAEWGGVYLGPYLGRFTTPTSPSFNIFCVDYTHEAGSQWVNVTSLASSQADANMSNTRLGATAGSLAQYQRVAYLSSLFASWQTFDPTDQRLVWSGIHSAIWTIMTGTTIGGSGAELAEARQFFVDLSAAQASSFNSDNWYVLSPSAGYDGQEFLIYTNTVPEPATYLLLATGLLFLVFLGRRRLGELVETT